MFRIFFALRELAVLELVAGLHLDVGIRGDALLERGGVRVARAAGDLEQRHVVVVARECVVEGVLGDRDATAERRSSLWLVEDPFDPELERRTGGRLQGDRRAEAERVVLGVAVGDEGAVAAEFGRDAAVAARPGHVDDLRQVGVDAGDVDRVPSRFGLAAADLRDGFDAGRGPR